VSAGRKAAASFGFKPRADQLQPLWEMAIAARAERGFFLVVGRLI
jgi:hypothetical protein